MSQRLGVHDPKFLLKIKKTIDFWMRKYPHSPISAEELFQGVCEFYLRNKDSKGTIYQTIIGVYRSEFGTKGRPDYDGAVALSKASQLESVPEYLFARDDFESAMHNRLALEKKYDSLVCERFQKIFVMLMHGCTQNEMAGHLNMSEERVSQLVEELIDSLADKENFVKKNCYLIQEVAQILGFKYSTFHRCLSAGIIPYEKAGDRKFITHDVLVQLKQVVREHGPLWKKNLPFTRT